MNITNPRFSSPDGSLINVDIDHPEFGMVSFTASPDDPEGHGRELYARAVAGEFGAIALYAGPSAQEILAQRARENRDRLVATVDLVVSNPLRWNAMDEAERAMWATYRQALLDVPQQNGFPFEIHWPEKP